MNMRQHLVGRIVFDLDAGRREGASALQQRVSSFAASRLALLIERCLDGYSEPGMPDYFERIELDLGRLDPARLEGQLAERIDHALRERLARQVREHVAAAEEGTAAAGDTETQAALKELGDYLEDGQGAAPAPVLALLIERAPSALVQLLARLGVRQPVRKRLANHFAQAQLGQVVRLLEPAHGMLVLSCVDEIDRVHAARPVVAQDGRSLRRAVWEFIFAYLLLERGSHFNTRAFAASLLRQIAGRYRIGYASLLDALGAGVESAALPFGARASLPGLLAELRADCAQAPAAAPRPSAAARQLRQLATYLDTGVGPGQDGPAAPALLDMLLDQQPDALRELLVTLGSKALVRRRLAQQLPEPLLARVVRLLEPAEARQIVRDVGTLRRLHADEALVTADVPGLARVLWQLVLDYLLCDRGSHFNRRAFVKATLRGLAARYGIAYRALLLAVLAHLPPRAARQAQGDTLADILFALSDETWLGVEPPPATGTAAPELAELLRGSPLARLVGELRAALTPLLPHADALTAYLLAALRAPGDAHALVRSVTAAACARYGLAYGVTLARMAAAPGAGIALRAACQVLLDELAPQPPRPQVDDLEMALTYLRHGHFPADADPDALAVALLQAPQQTAAALRAMPATPLTIARLLEHVTGAGLASLLAALAPQQHRPLLDFLKASAVLGERARALHWAYLLEALMAPGQAALIGPVALRCARSLGLTASAYRAALAKRLSGEALAALPTDGPPPAAQDEPATSGWRQLALMPDDAAPGTAALQCFLQFGVPPAAGLAASVERATRDERATLKALLLYACGRDIERARLARSMPPALLQVLLGEAFDAASRCLQVLRTQAGRWWSEADLIAALLAAVHARRGRTLDLGHLLHTLLSRSPAAFLPQQAQLLQRLDTEFDGRHGVADKAYRQQLRAAGRRLAAAQPWPAQRAPTTPWRFPEDAPAARLEGGFHITNGGAVLLWPFLHGYFAALGMLEGNRFRNTEAQLRAPQLVQLLAEGAFAPTEEGLLLNKLLCGLEGTEVLDHPGEPSEQEVALAEQILYSVTQHWEKLKNTTIPVLRHTFLMRGARLLRREDGWSLAVEPSAFDPLLQSLPWGLSTVRLPWMTGMLWVEWKR